MSEKLIWVGVYIHQYGTEVRLFSTEEKANEWRTTLAESGWDKEFPGEERPAREHIADRYFQLMMEESSEPDSFHIQSVEPDGGEALKYIS